MVRYLTPCWARWWAVHRGFRTLLALLWRPSLPNPVQGKPLKGVVLNPRPSTKILMLKHLRSFSLFIRLMNKSLLQSCHLLLLRRY
uniref:Putative secreted protein n=1 Tax=Ixodes ricinus TaxID=34613 RepID=A0A6B0TYR9_IXORI